MTFLGPMFLPPGEQYRRHIARALLDFAAERDAVERKAKCGRACDDLAGFEGVFADRLQERTG